MESTTGYVFPFQNIVLEENTMGRDGQEYVLRCSIDGPTLKLLGSTAVLSYDIPFLFYNGQLSHFLASFNQAKFIIPFPIYASLIS